MACHAGRNSKVLGTEVGVRLRQETGEGVKYL